MVRGRDVAIRTDEETIVRAVQPVVALPSDDARAEEAVAVG